MLNHNWAFVEDKGDYWKVLASVKGYYLDLNKGQFLSLSHAASKIIADALKKNKHIFIHRPLKHDSVQPDEIKIRSVGNNELQEVKESAIKKIQNVIDLNLAKNTGYVLYRHLCSMNELGDRGYVITESNREEKYLEILETGDEDLISLLENYLNTKEKMLRASYLFQPIKTLSGHINSENSIEEIRRKTENFLTKFYSHF
ncbi:MAG: hypothetical protein A2504_06980 [Bdellovibrionales bacterium RIFOXYD12_FULL_39_22]|nr:MAG: hypothetical protein A2385_05195 [Bdellovibrionales bacterium RIFOXYB1_FULL_39_21]OFZ44318.1 MAG: hypothetical protein A2485_15975 [Bdellovibrionales bacterium RIFOXYC12_FULL_39_17]OFZ49173.1 MAG: hypothetical protein A2404_15915 [Bdellovibrionales bacterium RIFOXYC1_FULL_39_130]OFZ76981.1 MAG: hypothetical protein A2560_11000 [Bdellovibrionales bacterium RIFOXYD1_FULL_39_84]OFZ95194.1 MAG: hypothetical protein A2504_06980 [Bdellovibrionales bacterium RIFOXYD12_FULL_39_22]HLE09653.1 hy